jgi:hypothetical protein
VTEQDDAAATKLRCEELIDQKLSQSSLVHKFKTTNNKKSKKITKKKEYTPRDQKTRR